MYCALKNQKKGHDCLLPPLQVQERRRECSTQVSNRSEHGMAAANTWLPGGEVISALLCADVFQTAIVSEALFPHVHTWKKQNIFT